MGNINWSFSRVKSYELILKGKPVAPGIAIGRVLVLKNIDIEELRQNGRSIENATTEIARLELSRLSSREQVRKTFENVRQHGRAAIADIFSAYISLLDDPGLLDSVKLLIESRKLASESIIADQIIALKSKQKSGATDFSRKLYETLQDLYLRLIYNLLPANSDRITRILKAKFPVIAIAEKLTPVEVANMPMQNLLAVLVEEVTNTSHTAILCRTLSVPVVVDLPGIGPFLDESSEIIVDGYRGHVVINPGKRTVEEYRRFENKITVRKKSAPKRTLGLYRATLDRVEVKLAASAGTLIEVEKAYQAGVNEIGLLRSEIFYLARQKPPSVIEESDFYADMLVKGMKKVTVRLLDIGADKIPAYMPAAKEANPELGLRGIRYLLHYPDILRKQVRSILHCAKPEATRILLPFVSIMDDLDEGLSIITEVLAESGYSRNSVEIGIMVEIPSVALTMEDFLPKVDFVNLGTNDLIQYTFAVDREQNDVSKYSRFTHPAGLKIIRSVINAADRHGKELVSCGTMASHPHGICLLMGLGVRNFSIQVDMLSEIRTIVSRVNTNDLEALVSHLDDFKYASEVEDKIKGLFPK